MLKRIDLEHNFFYLINDKFQDNQQILKIVKKSNPGVVKALDFAVVLR